MRITLLFIFAPIHMLFADTIYDVSVEFITLKENILELKYTVNNSSSKDIWVCKEVGYGSKNGLTLIENTKENLLILDMSLNGINDAIDYEEGLNLSYYKISPSKSETFTQFAKLPEKTSVFNMKDVRIRIGYYEEFPKKFKEISDKERTINMFQSKINGEQMIEKTIKYRFEGSFKFFVYIPVSHLNSHIS